MQFSINVQIDDIPGLDEDAVRERLTTMVETALEFVPSDSKVGTTSGLAPV